MRGRKRLPHEKSCCGLRFGINDPRVREIEIRVCVRKRVQRGFAEVRPSAGLKRMRKSLDQT